MDKDSGSFTSIRSNHAGVFKPNPLNFYLLASLLALFVGVPFTFGIWQMAKGEFLLGFVLFFVLIIGTLPFTLIFWIFLDKMLKEKVIVNNSGIEFFFEKAVVKIKWTECKYFYWEGTCVRNTRSGDKFYRLFELSNDENRIRFNEWVKRSSLSTYSIIPYFGAKSWDKKTYGINLSPKDTEKLIGFIKTYSRLEPVMRIGLWRNY